MFWPNFEKNVYSIYIINLFKEMVFSRKPTASRWHLKSCNHVTRMCVNGQQNNIPSDLASVWSVHSKRNDFRGNSKAVLNGVTCQILLFDLTFREKLWGKPIEISGL